MPLARTKRSIPSWKIPARLVPIWVVLQLVVGLVIGVGIFDRVLMPLAVGRGDNETVPQLRGIALEEVRRRLEEEGLEIGEVTEVVDDDLPVGSVVAQDPVGGSNVQKGRRVRVLVSRGPSVRAVPDLVGQTVRSATIALAQQDLRSGSVLAVPAAEPEGRVIGSRPPRGFSPEREGKVDLLVSAGPRRFVYLMPDLRGMRVGEARAMVQGTGLHLVLEGENDWIMMQDPPPGRPVRSGESIRVG